MGIKILSSDGDFFYDLLFSKEDAIKIKIEDRL